MSTPELPFQESSHQFHALLNEIRNQIRNLPDIYQHPLAGSLDRLTGLLEAASHAPGQPPAVRRSASLDVPTEPAYLFARDLPVPVMRQMEIVLDNLDSAIFVFDKSGTIRRANARARAMLGIEPVGMSREKFYSQVQVYTAGEQPLDLTNCPVGRAARGETVSREAVRVYIPGGRAYSILASAIPIEVNNQFTGVVSVWSDVTELERLTGQIEAERDQLKTILESISDEVWYADQHGNIRLMNEQAARNLGIEHPEGINQSPVETLLDELEISNPDGTLRANEETPLLRSLGGETNRGQEIVRNKRTGQTMMREFTSAPIRSRDRVVGAVAVIRDITRQKRQEQFLRESELRERARAAELYALMNAVPAVIFVTHDPQARLVTGNRMAHQLMRVGEGHNFSKARLSVADSSADTPRHYRIYHQGRELMPQELPLERCAASGLPVREFEEDLLFDDGSQVHLVGNVTPLFDETGQPAGAVAAYIDITQRVNVEQALRESEERLRTVLDNSRDVVYRHNLDEQRFDFVSPVVEQVLGWAVEEANQVESEKVFSRIHPDDLPSIHMNLQRVTAAGKGTLEFRFQRKDGQYRWLSDHITVMKDPEGRAHFTIGTIRDITERKEVEASLRQAAEQLLESERVLQEANERFRVALAAAPITVFTMDHELCYTWVYSMRSGLQGVPGSPDEHALGRRDDELYPPEDVEELMEVKWSVIATGEPVQQEVMVRMGDEWSTFVITLDPLKDAKGQVVGLTGSALDISQQRRLELENLEQITQMEIQRRLLESREQERQEIARDLHDGPIQILSSTLFSLKLGKELAEDPQVKDDYEQITTNVRNAVQELRDMVNELRPPVSIRFGLAMAIRGHAEEFGEKHPELALALDLADDENRLPEQVSLHLFRVYQEGLNNILRHARATQAWVRFSLAAGQVQLEIRDNGAGFEVPGNLVESAQNRHFGLLGMTERCESIGGRLEIISHPGQGTLLRATVPGT